MASECFIRLSTAKKLHLPLKKLNNPVACSGLGDNVTVIAHEASVLVGDGPDALLVHALVTPKICDNVGFTSVNKESKTTTTSVQLDVLLSAAHTWSIVKSVHAFPKDDGCGYYVIHTTLGKCATQSESSTPAQPVVLMANKDLERAFARFYSLELIGISSGPDDERRAEEVEAEQLLDAKAYFEDGTYVMPLLFKPEARMLRNNCHIAAKRLFNLERTLAKDPNLKELYTKEIQALFDRGDARYLREDEIETPVAFYLPHRPVVRMDKETSKIRPVFDASAKNQDGISLNTEILQTPVLHPPLTGILLRFRRNLIALIGDVSKMFLRMKLHPEHERYQRFLWRPDPEGPVKHAVIIKMAFGLADSPFKALRGVQKLVEKYRHLYPDAARELARNLYVDDLLSGCDDETDALRLYQQCVELLSKASLPMKKWCTSSSKVMRQIPSADRGEIGNVLLTGHLQDEAETDGGSKPSATALGVEWDVKRDELHYTGFAQMNLPTSHCTKRSIVSAVASFFDPLGLISPFVVSAKILIQQLWKQALDWDEQVPRDVEESWKLWVNEVQHLNKITFPRCFRKHPGKEVQKQLLAFGDASEAAMGAAVYIRTVYEDGHCEVHLLMAKAKVAPLKELSLPRKELAAAVMTTKLLAHVAEHMDMDPKDAKCFSDSMTTLLWLRKHPRSWKQWVANRVQQVHDLTDPSQWQHVAGVDNPADLPSRGLPASELVDNSMWFHGPAWLSRPEIEWPKEAKITASSEYLEEQKIPVLSEVPVLVTPTTDDRLQSLWNMSDFHRMISLTRRLRSWLPSSHGISFQLQWQRSLDVWIKRAQRDSFKEEIHAIRHGKPLPTGSRLRPLTPFLDDNDILRVGGRLQHSDQAFEVIHPVILPKAKPRSLQEVNDNITGRLIWHKHVQCSHAGVEWMNNHLREKYWIVSARTSIRNVLSKCIICRKAIGRTDKQKMAPLPSSRVQRYEPWTVIGIDYAGPFAVKPMTPKDPVNEPEKSQKRQRGRPRIKPVKEVKDKAYIIIFTDFTTRGVHFEVALNMDTGTFFDAFRRFTSRRGIPKEIHSDEARNFLKAKSDLLSLFKYVDQDQLVNGLERYGVEWHVNVPHAPFRGGVWERLLRYYKETFRKLVYGRIPKVEELVTVTTEIEALMNDRPLCPLTSDPEDWQTLTPSKLMSGRLLRSLPAAADGGAADSRPLAIWNARQRCINGIWEKFLHVYVREILPRTSKWQDESTRPLQEGELVLLATETPARGHWPLARIVALKESHNARDGIIRTAVVRLATGSQLTRPVQQLVRLEFGNSVASQDVEPFEEALDPLRPQDGAEEARTPPPSDQEPGQSVPALLPPLELDVDPGGPEPGPSEDSRVDVQPRRVRPAPLPPRPQTARGRGRWNPRSSPPLTRARSRRQQEQ